MYAVFYLFFCQLCLVKNTSSLYYLFSLTPELLNEDSQSNPPNLTFIHLHFIFYNIGTVDSR